MKTVIMGQNIIHKYKVNSNLKDIIGDNGETKPVFTAKPVIEIADEITNEKICEFEGTARFNSPQTNFLGCNYLTIKGKEQAVLRTEFEVTTQTENIYTDTVLNETNDGKENAEKEFAGLIEEYNRRIIEGNEKMLRHCKLYNLDPKKTDCEELFKEVYPHHFFYLDSQGNLSPQAISRAQEFATSSTYIPGGKIQLSSAGSVGFSAISH